MASGWLVAAASLNGLQPWLRPYADYAIQLMRLHSGGTVDARGRVTGGVVPTITSGYRSVSKQQELYENRANNPYPVNRPGDSAHNYGLAFDSDVPDRWMPLWIAVRRAVGFTVPSNDEVHAEYPNWRSLVPQKRS